MSWIGIAWSALQTKTGAYVGCALVIAVFAWWAYGEIFSSGKANGRDGVLTEIIQENTDAGNRSEEWRAALRHCNRTGGLFDFEHGTCDR